MVLKNKIVFVDIFLLSGAIPAVLLPIFGFVAACVQVRGKDDYVSCVKDGSDGLQFQLRFIQSLFYLFSICYFLIIIRPTSEDRYVMIGALMLLTQLALIVGSLIGFGILSGSNCKNTSYHSIVTFINVIALLFGAVTLGI